MKNGERVDWPIYDDPRNAERYFAIIDHQLGLSCPLTTSPAVTPADHRPGPSRRLTS